MTGLLVAAQPARTIVIERGGTPWWVPFVSALGVALAAAAASYYATWRFKRADVNRENAFRCAGQVDEAERIASRSDRFEEDGPETTLALLQQAQLRARPIRDYDLDDRFRAAIAQAVALRRIGEEGGWVAGRARHWLAVAIWDVRAALFPHLSAPTLVPWSTAIERRFPTFDEFVDIAPLEGDADDLVSALDAWKAKQPRSE